MLSMFRKTGLENPFDAPILYAPEVGSTMDVAKELILREEAQHGIVLWSGHQTAGRGRLADRRWEETPGGALLFTLLLDNTVAMVGSSQALSLRIGLAVAETVDRYLPKPSICRVKWPNDVLLSGRKVSGILITKGRRWTQIGIGINILQSAVPPALARQATSIEEAARCPGDELASSEFTGGALNEGKLNGGVLPSRETLLQQILEAVRVELTEQTDLTGLTEGEPWHRRLSRRLAYRGERVRCDAPAFPVPVTGVVVGINQEGALLLSGIEAETEPSSSTAFPDPWSCFDGEITLP